MDKLAHDFLQSAEACHWWFLGRRRIIQRALEVTFNKPTKEVLDIGSGYGGMLPLLLKYSSIVDSLEPVKEAHESIMTFGARTIFNIDNFPDDYPKKQYDAVTMFDVLEHIQDDTKTMQIIRDEILKPKGKIVITVPANQWLWSVHDEINHHVRRYSKKSLRELLGISGYQNIKISYFMTFLFPLALLQRLFLKWNQTKEEFKSVHPVLNFILKKIFTSESYFLYRFPFPFGLSLIATAEKSSEGKRGSFLLNK